MWVLGRVQIEKYWIQHDLAKFERARGFLQPFTNVVQFVLDKRPQKSAFVVRYGSTLHL